MKIVLTVAAVLLVLGAVGGFVAVQNGAFSAKKPAVKVRLETAERGRLTETVSAPGQISPRTKVSISARVAARIAELPFKAGDDVTRGDPAADPPVAPSVVVRLDAKDLEANLKSAEARYDAQRAQRSVAEARVAAGEAAIGALRVTLTDAERDLRRQLALFESRDVSQSVVDEAQARVDELQARLNSAAHDLAAERANLTVLQHNQEAAEADILRARDALSYTVIESPIDGTVTKVNAEAGELVVTGTMNNAGTVILEIADFTEMLMRARVDETVVSGVSAGQRATVRIPAYRDETFEGVVERVALAVTEERDGSRFYETEIRLRTDGRRIFTGLNCDADIETRSHEGVLRVPSQAVLGRAVDDLPPDIRARPEVEANKTFTTVVYRFAEGKAIVTPVRIGASDLTHTEIVAGLEPGAAVIAGPYKVLESLKHEQAVEDEKATTRPATQPADSMAGRQ